MRTASHWYLRSTGSRRSVWPRNRLLMSAAGQTVYSDLDGQIGRFPSQFFRRRIAEHFGLEVPWDWRAYTDVEPALLRTLGVDMPAHAR